MNNMEEKNQETLRDALNRLSSYQPKDNLWESLKNNLSEEELVEVPVEDNREELQAALGRLARYRAPKKIWNRIEQRLHRPKISWIPMSIAAGLVALILTGGLAWYLWGGQTETYDTPSVSEKKVEETIELTQAENATYNQDLTNALEAVQDCIDNSSERTKTSYQQELESLQSLSLAYEELLEDAQSEQQKVELARIDSQRWQLVFLFQEKICNAGF